MTATATARARARQTRDAFLCDLARAGVEPHVLALGANLSRKQIGRILAAAGVGHATGPSRGPPGLMPLERRASGEVLEWLASIRQDRRHNGRPMVDPGPGREADETEAEGRPEAV